MNEAQEILFATIKNICNRALAMVGMGDSPDATQNAEAILDKAPAAPPNTAAPVPAPVPVPTSSATQPSGEHFMAWLHWPIPRQTAPG